MRKSVIIADDHPLSGEGIKSILSQANDVVVEEIVNNGIDAIKVIRKLKPDCAIVDLAMPGANGLEVLIEAKRWSPNTKIMILTGNHSATQFKLLKDSGVDAILLKNTEPKQLIEQIQSVLNGEMVFSDEVDSLIEMLETERSITKRELEILKQLSQGFSNNTISKNLGISHKTVDSHRTNLMRKFDVNSTTTLLLTAIREGYIEA